MARLIAVAEPKAKAARQMRATAGLLDDHHPEMMAGDHLRDAARLTEAGRTDSAKRHLDAAMFMLTPQSLFRHGILDDDGHADAKHHMHQINRHRLAVEDIEDIQARNERTASMARAERGEPEPMEPFHRPPPEFLTVGQSAHGTFVASQDHYGNRVMDLVGPHGYVHGWVHVGPAPPGTDPVAHQAAHWSEMRDHMIAPPEEGGHGLGKDVVEQVGYDTRSMTALHRMQHGSGRYPGHTHRDTPDEQRAKARQQRISQGLERAPGGLANSSPAILLSARTAMLERTPAPRGRPGGPGLYRVKGMGHTAYLQQVVKALIEKRGMRPDKAYAIARAAIRKWSVRSRHPEVRGAATRAEAGEVARQARAKMSHANDWTVADVLIELACDDPGAVIDLFNPYHAPTGQFTTASGAGQGKQQQAAQRADKRGDRQQRAHLVRQIASLHQQIAALRAQLPGKSRSSAPRKTGAGATSAKQAAQAKASAAKPGAAGSTKARKPGMSAATIHGKIAALEATLRADIAQLRSLK